jgi:dTMP kinase
MFVCIEGIDGAGKSTQAANVCEALKLKNFHTMRVADPGTTILGKKIRQILLESDDSISEFAQMLLFSAARAELSKLISTARENVAVIADRWVLSTLVYQSVLNGINEQLILDIFNATCVKPDICILLDIDPVTADARKDYDALKKDRYERIDVAQKIKLRDAYLHYALKLQQNMRTIILDANRPADVITTEILSHIRP